MKVYLWKFSFWTCTKYGFYWIWKSWYVIGSISHGDIKFWFSGSGNTGRLCLLLQIHLSYYIRCIMNFKKIADTSFKKLNFEKMKKIAGDIIILYKCTKSHNHMSSGSWDTKWNTEFLVILGHFWPFYPPLPHDNLENQNFEKLKKASRDIIILHMCTKNDMMYSSWGVEFFLIFEHFLPFCPPSPP